MKIYEVGGSVRDGFLGIPTNDYDFAVEAESYDAMREELVKKGLVIWQERPEFYTIRGKMKFGDVTRDADFVLCRIESDYSDSRRPDSVRVGTIIDDLMRRDFTCNAIAKDENGHILDPFGGYADTMDKVLRTVGNVEKQMNQDRLRIIRAIRFRITRGFDIEQELDYFIKDIPTDYLASVSTDRIRTEIEKCFRFNSLNAIKVFSEYEYLLEDIFSRGIWLKATTEMRKNQ